VNAITVRNLPPAVAKAVRQKAKKEKLSLNKAVVKLLEEATGVERRAGHPSRPRPPGREVVGGGVPAVHGRSARATADRPEMWK